ncbi:hypothetical protein [uncultured Duncaniella sp.]|uniref:hypothetical protein n=1 Tax=uncultured Duncaniella sp. TaxID=2768039 RepID=UPI00266F492A|nr:hypothetical protein [uncultured Duncaniella sp.]
MTASEFTTAIQSLIPSKDNFYNLPKDFMEIYISQLSIRKKGNSIDVPPEDAVIDLVMNYDVSNLTIGIFSFKNELIENDNFIFFGTREAFPIAISKKSKEIVEIDWADENRVISFIAKNQSNFLCLLISIEELNQKLTFGLIDSNIYRDAIVSLYEIAGGIKYKNQLEDL